MTAYQLDQCCRKRFLGRICLIVSLCLAPALASAIEPLWSVERLNQSKAEWPNLTASGLRIEGRVASQIKGQLRFQKCDLSFRLTPELERRLTQSKNLEVTGQMRRDGNQVYFEVTAVTPQPGDIEQFRSREAGFKNPQPKDWYDLADWAAERARFYADDELLAAAMSSRARGVAAELARLTGDDFQGRFDLAEQAQQFGLPERVVDEMRHEGYRVWWIQATPASNPQPDMLKTMENRLRRDWPEAFVPGNPFPTELQAKYTQDPLGTYHATELEQRQILRRMFAAEVQLKRLDLQLSADGKNGREIAEQVEALVPERKVIAERYRDLALMYRLGEITTASRSEALDLAERFRQRQRPQQASEVLLRWLTEKERRLRPETAPEFIELADDYLALLKDETRAVSLLTEAHKREPESAEVLRRWQQLGYAFDGVQWKKSRQPTTDVPLPADTTLPRQLEKGMSQAQLQQMLGEPTSRQRVASGAGISQFWIYGRVGEGSRLVIELQRTDKDAPYRVWQFYSR